MAVTITEKTTVDSPFNFVEIYGTFEEVFQEISKRTEPNEARFFEYHKHVHSDGKYRVIIAYNK